jgi:8-amino-7-oxononanoate synthase
VRRAPRLDLTTALFLDLRHSSSELPQWESFTTGVPAAVGEIPLARRVAGHVAQSHGSEAGLVARSTLHALVDVFTELPRGGDVVAVDEAAYPTIRYAAASARRPGITMLTYRHHRPDTVPDTGRRVVIATEGWCAGCGRPAPVAELSEIAARSGGVLVVDDSLAYGVLGGRKGGEVFGDGTGTIRWLSRRHDGILWLASFAKAYGTPIAVVTGSRYVIERMRASGNRLHSSPPSTPDVMAAWHALALAPELHRRRQCLQAAVVALRAALTALGLPVVGLPFPVVAIPMSPAVADVWWRRLRADGIDAIVQLPRCRSGALLSFIVRSQHSPQDINRIALSLRRIKESRSAA